MTPGRTWTCTSPASSPSPAPANPGRAAPPAARLISRQPPGQQATAPPGPVPIGIRDGQEITADPAALGGLGLTGPGAPAAARAILAGLLARPPRGPDGTPAEIIIPAADAARLLPGPPGQRAHPPIRGVSVPPALDAALDEAEAMIVRRARTARRRRRPAGRRGGAGRRPRPRSRPAAGRHHRRRPRSRHRRHPARRLAARHHLPHHRRRPDQRRHAAGGGPCRDRGLPPRSRRPRRDHRAAGPGPRALRR